jgi:hypothetical protein
MLFGSRKQLGSDHLSQPSLIVDDGRQFVDPSSEIIALGLELDAGKSREAAQRHLEDVRRLLLGEVEDRHEALACGRGVIARADELDDLIDVEDGDEEAIDQVEAFAGSRPPVLTATSHDLTPVIDEHLEEFA